MIPCCYVASVRNWKPWGTTYNFKQVFRYASKHRLQYVKFDDPSPEPLPSIPFDCFICRAGVIFKRACGHQDRISCVLAYYKLQKPCQVVVNKKYSSCGSERSVLCKDVSSSIVNPCNNLVLKQCSRCKINQVKVECSKETVSCIMDVTVTQVCGHLLTWNCMSEIDPRTQYCCSNCTKYFKGSEGLKCSQRHFVCTACLFTALDNINSLDKHIDDDGNLRCLNCSNTFGLFEISKLPCSDLFLPLVQDLIRKKLQMQWPAWRMLPTNRLSYCNIYEINTSDHAACIACRETTEFNIASAQFCRLLCAPLNIVKTVQVIEYERNSPVIKKFEEMKATLVNIEQIWVFHGTNEVSLNRIIVEGFKVGGVDNISIINGKNYGNGVYTATGPKTPMTYSKGNNKIILAKALPGQRSHNESRGDSDSWVPRDDWMVFRSGSQLLPCYVVVYDDAKC